MADRAVSGAELECFRTTWAAMPPERRKARMYRGRFIEAVMDRLDDMENSCEYFRDQLKEANIEIARLKQ